MTESQNKPAAALEWKSFDSPPPDGTEIVWKDEQDQIGTGYYCAEDAKWWKGFWMTAHELVNFAPKASAVPKIIKLDTSVNCYAFGSEVSMPRPPSPPQAEEAPAAPHDRIVALLREARATLEMWKDVAPAVSLCQDIDSALVPAVPTSRVQPSIDTPEFQQLVEYWRKEPYGTRSFENAWAEMVAHIDAKLVLAREDALREAAKICDDIGQDYRDQYKGRGQHEPNNPRRADPYADGASDGAWQCEGAISTLLQPQQKSDTPR